MNSDTNGSQSAFSFVPFLPGACKLFANTVQSLCALTKGNVDYVLIFRIDGAAKKLPRPLLLF